MAGLITWFRRLRNRHYHSTEWTAQRDLDGKWVSVRMLPNGDIESRSFRDY